MTTPDVTAALAAVMAELGGIEKLTAAERARRGMGGGDQGVAYAYRGIDQIAAQVQPLLAKHGVVIVPTSTTSTVKEIIVNNRPWTDTFIRIEWLVAGPNGTSLQACSEGQGRDNSDKGINKATTSAFKNLLLRLLCIGDPTDDTDGHTHEADMARPAPDKRIVALWDKVMAAKDTPHAAVLKQAAQENNMKLTMAALADDEQWAAIVEAILNEPVKEKK